MANQCVGANFQSKRRRKNCNAYRGVKLLEHAIKIVDRVLKRRLRKLVKVDKMRFGVSPGRETTDALFVVKRF